MVCRCLNPDQDAGRGQRLERLVLEQPAAIQVAPVSIHVSRLRTDNYDIRKRRAPERVRDIAESIVFDGLFAPPGGVASADGYIDILMGHTRILAMRDMLGWEEIPVRIFHWWGDSDWDRRARAFKENGLRQNMDFDEEVALVYGYWRESGQSVRQVARFFGMSPSWAHERIAWGKRGIGVGDRDNGTGDDGDGSSPHCRRRTYPPRITLPADEVKEWLNCLHRAGIPVPNDCEKPSAETLRAAMLAILETFQKK